MIYKLELSKRKSISISVKGGVLLVKAPLGTTSARAEAVIENCAHPDYKQLLWDYVKMGKGGQTPHTLNAALAFHTEFAASGDMRNVDWSKFE